MCKYIYIYIYGAQPFLICHKKDHLVTPRGNKSMTDDDGRRTTTDDDGRQMTTDDDGRRRQTTDDGRRRTTTDDGRRTTRNIHIVIIIL